MNAKNIGNKKGDPYSIMIKIILDGRTDTDDYFRLSGVFQSECLCHTPFLVFLASEDTVEVRIINKPAELFNYIDDTPVMGQWRGNWRSDFFQFTVGQYRQYLEAKYEPFKSAKNIVRKVGPQGGFRSLSYEYMDQHGAIVSTSTASKAEAERLEAFFARQGVQVLVEKER